MNLSRQQIKLNAKKALKGNYGVLVGGILLLGVILYAIYIPMYLITMLPIILSAMTQSVVAAGISTAAMMFLNILVVSVVATLLSAGSYRMIYEVITQGNTKIGTLFFAFKNRPITFLKWTMLSVLVGIALMIPSIGAIFGGAFTENITLTIIGFVLYFIMFIVILLLSPIFTVAFFILVEEPQVGAFGSYKLGMHVLKGNMVRFWGLLFSFFGMYILAMLSWGIGFLWFMPYFQASTYLFIQDIKNAKMQNYGYQTV